MNFEEFKIVLDKEVKKVHIELNEEQKNKFYKYMDMLIEWNKKINLTAITVPKEIIVKHFLDSLTVSKYIGKNLKTIDIGTGAGFPGIPLLINEETIKLTLLDSLNKRIIFLKEVEKELEIKAEKIIHGRAEELGQKEEFREKYDICTSRAVAPLNILLEYMMPFVKKGGKCICMKGQNIEEELEKSKEAVKELGGKLEKIEKISLSKNENQRNIIIIKKQENMSKKYPRKEANIRKYPL